MHFLFVLFYLFTLPSYIFIFVFMYLSLASWIGSLSNFIINKFLTFLHIFGVLCQQAVISYLKRNCLITFKAFNTANHLWEHYAWRSNIISVIIPIKYLNDLFVPYAYSLQTNILFTSMSSILNAFLILQKSLFLTFLSSNFMLFPLILILGEKKY